MYDYGRVLSSTEKMPKREKTVRIANSCAIPGALFCVAIVQLFPESANVKSEQFYVNSTTLAIV